LGQRDTTPTKNGQALLDLLFAFEKENYFSPHFFFFTSTSFEIEITGCGRAKNRHVKEISRDSFFLGVEIFWC
jgi:hypothetical protein